MKLKTYLEYEEVKGMAESLVNAEEKRQVIDAILKNERIEKASSFVKIIPHTWQLMHTKDDRLETLTDYSFELVMNYLKKLAKKMEKY